MKHSSFDATISALDVETSAFGAETSANARRSFDATILALDAETSTRSDRAELLANWRRVSGDCEVGITRRYVTSVTNHGDISTFSKPVPG